MGSKTRIYTVATVDTVGAMHLVEATSQSAAWRHVAHRCVGKPRLPNGKDIAELMGKGVKVEEAEEVE